MPPPRTGDLACRLDAIVAFLPLFEAPDFEFGRWETSRSDEPTILISPYFSFSDTARQFVQAAYDCNWVLSNFDWQAWAEAAELRDDRDALENASPEQLAMLLTWQIRNDRFSEGALSGSFSSGLLLGILRRAKAIRVGLN